MTSLPSNFDSVFEAELQEIGNRRKVHAPSGTNEEPSESRRQSLVGIALSGGGVRSAGVGLGFLQALYRSGFLKLVDYMSTVSGGGYTGAMLSSEISSDTEGLSWERNGTENRLSIDAPSASGQPSKVYELALYGRRMGELLKMLSRHLFGWMVTIAFLLSGIVCVSSLFAWLMRQCWSPTGMALLPCFGFNTDIERAFFPAFVAFLLWIASLILQRICQIFEWKMPPTSRVTYVTLLCSLVLGVLVLLGIDDVGIDDWMELYGLPSSVKGQLQSLIHGIAATASVAVTATLIPFFSPKSLLNSGRRDSNFFQRAIFNFAGYGVVFAVPLFVFYFIARENISNHHRELLQVSEMSPSRLRNFDKFLWELQSDPDDRTALQLRQSFGESLDLENWMAIDRQLSIDRGTSHVVPFLRYCVEWIQPGVSGNIEAAFQARSAQERLMRKFAKANTINCLSVSNFFADQNIRDESTLNDSQRQVIRKAEIELSALQFMEISLCYACLDESFRSYTPPEPETPAQRFTQRQTHRPDNCLELLKELDLEIERLSTMSGDPDDQKYVIWLTAQKQQTQSVLEGIRAQNTAILEQLFPAYIAPADTIYARDVNEQDQFRRLQLAFGGFLLFIVIGLLSNVNNGSLHSVYRDEISDVWLPSKSLLLKDLNSCRNGGPLHLINCTMNHLSSTLDPDAERQSRFVMSHQFVGSKRTGYRRTEDFQDGKLTVADAVAISGAAVTVTAADNLLYRVLLVLTNFRLGQWLRNPASYYPDHFWPSPLRTLLGLLWDAHDRAFCYVSDGGHLENTGIAALLERRCKLIIASDASDDPHYEFEDLMRLFQASRAKHHVEFRSLGMVPGEKLADAEILDQVRPRENSWSRQHFLAFQVLYPKRDHEPASEGLLIVMKSSLTGDEPLDLLELKRRGRIFPHDPTSNQFLPPACFESYVMLGRHMANDVLKYLGNTERDLKLPDSIRLWKDSLNNDQHGMKIVEPAALHLSPEDPFSEEMISKAGLMLNEWKITPPLETTSEDEIVEEISRWARHHETALITLRRKFCKFLITIVDENLDRLRSSSTATLEFDSMLLMLGRGIAEANRARKRLRAETLSPEQS